MCPVLQVYGAHISRPTVDWVMEEIETLYDQYGVRQIGFLDDNLMFDRKWAYELLERIIARKFKGLSLTFEEGLDVPTALDEKLLILMKKAGFTHTKLGVESFDDDTLNLIRKPYRRGELAIKAIELLKKHKLSPVCFICIGFPTDTEEKIRKNIEILKSLKVKLRVQILWAYPGVETIQGKGLSHATLKALQREAMYGTNSVAWRHPPKAEKAEISLAFDDAS
jgi:anaerobic magnesium-protoporphyrin IX monomethyl ester cyclase